MRSLVIWLDDCMQGEDNDEMLQARNRRKDVIVCLLVVVAMKPSLPSQLQINIGNLLTITKQPLLSCHKFRVQV